MRELGKIFVVKQLTTSGYGPQTNGSLERSHIVLTGYIKHYADGFDDWDRLLPFAMFAYNTSVHEPSNISPFELVYGRVARIPSSFPTKDKLETYGSYLRDQIIRLNEIQKITAKNMIQAKEQSKLRYDKTAQPLNAVIDDRVMIFSDARKNKFDKRAVGICTIVGFTENHNVILEANDGTRFTKHADKVSVVHC